MDGWGKVRQAAQYAGLKERTFRDLLKTGLLHSRLPSGTILIRFSDIDLFLQKFQVKENQVETLVSEAVKEFHI